jgi:hypothetical protein
MDRRIVKAWFEGAMTAGCSQDKAVDEAIQANIVAAQFAAN